MKQLTYLISIAFFSLQLNAQTKIDRTKQPKPGPAPIITISDPAIFNLKNGMTVIVVENHKLPKVSATLSIDAGPIVEGKKAGVNELMGQMLSEGTTLTSKDKFDAQIDQMGANVSMFGSGAFASALTRYFDKSFMLMAEAIQHPAFPAESFEKIRTQKLTGLKSNEKSASAISSRVVAALSFGKESAQGEFETEETIKGLSLDDIKKAYADYITPSRSYLTFVGDITPANAKMLAEKAFGSWSGRTLSLPVIANVENPKTSEINFVNLPTAVQGEITVSMLIDNPLSNPDYHALMIANQIIGGGAESKLFMNLREKHGFTYGSYANVGNGRFQTRFSCSAQVRSEKADSAVAEIMNEINNMRRGLITEEELNNAKAKYNGSYALGMEDPSRTATYASNILINNLPKDYYKTFLQKINAVTIADVKRVSNKYFNNDRCRVVIVGNGAKILSNLERLGYPVKQYDKYANAVGDKKAETAQAKPVAEAKAITAQDVVNNYLTAIGGKAAAEKINTMKAEFTSSVQGYSLTGTDIRKAPNKHYMDLKMGAMKVMESNFDGAKGYRVQQGQKSDMDADELKEATDEKHIIAQLDYLSADYKATVTGTEIVGNENAYVLKITKPSGKETTEYYSVKTGLLLKEMRTENAQGTDVVITITYSDYKKAGDILFPYTITQDFGGMEMTMNMTNMLINEGVNDTDFAK